MAQHAQVADRRLWLAVPHEEKDEAVAAGGLASDGRPNISWSPDDKLWYAREGTALAGIRLWLLILPRGQRATPTPGGVC